jgi:hypothetical protein
MALATLEAQTRDRLAALPKEKGENHAHDARANIYFFSPLKS